MDPHISLPALFPLVVCTFAAQGASAFWFSHVCSEPLLDKALLRLKESNKKLLLSSVLQLVDAFVIGVVYEQASKFARPEDCGLTAFMLLLPSLLFNMTGLCNCVIWESQNLAYYLVIAGATWFRTISALLGYHLARLLGF
ncbi:MAG: uncharacterized protein KVP18_001215 [Porospora cf. gigantea A]|uniref:uncharacterized protein n=1 Tax=Porospora cf. gigantea A TaxID=2853593 RepID=UPI003559AC03|nr:MAG: hypothetical protein KVP18_001215 [Porospora cf. gigantea A]